jgi:hypothetical protein
MTTGAVACANPILQCLNTAELPNVDGTQCRWDDFAISRRTYVLAMLEAWSNQQNPKYYVKRAQGAAVTQRVMIRRRCRQPSRPQLAAALNRRRHKFHRGTRAALLCDQIGLSAFGANHHSSTSPA